MRETVWRAASATTSCADNGASHFELKQTSVASFIEYAVDLLGVGCGVRRNLLRGQRRAHFVAPAWVADHAGKIADHELDRVSLPLKLPQLVDQHRVPEMQVGRRRIETGLDHQRLACGQALFERIRRQHFRSTAQ